MDEDQAKAMVFSNELKRMRNEKKKDEKYKEKVLDFDTIRREFKHALLGYEVQEKWFETEDGTPVAIMYVEFNGRMVPLSSLDQDQKQELRSEGYCNKAGARKVITYVAAFANEVVGASHFKKQETFKLGYKSSVAITDVLEADMEKYGVDSYEDLEAIGAMVDGILMGILGKSRDGAVLKHLGDKEQVRRIETDAGEDGGRFPNIFGG